MPSDAVDLRMKHLLHHICRMALSPLFQSLTRVKLNFNGSLVRCCFVPNKKPFEKSALYANMSIKLVITLRLLILYLV